MAFSGLTMALVNLKAAVIGHGLYLRYWRTAAHDLIKSFDKKPLRERRALRSARFRAARQQIFPTRAASQNHEQQALQHTLRARVGVMSTIFDAVDVQRDRILASRRQHVRHVTDREHREPAAREFREWVRLVWLVIGRSIVARRVFLPRRARVDPEPPAVRGTTERRDLR